MSEPQKVTIVRYVDKQGKRVPKGTPGARKVQRKSKTYCAYLPNPQTGKRQRVSLKTSDLGQAWVKLRDLQHEARQRAAGIGDRFTEQALRPLEEHLQEWLAVIRAKGTTAKQVGTLQADLRRLAQLAGWSRLGDVTGSSCLIALGQLQKEPGRGTSRQRGGRSAQTRNHYLAHARQFTRWCRNDGRLQHDPLTLLEAINVATDRRHDRRAPTDLEIARLYEYLTGDKAARRCLMTGLQRALAYKVAMATGYRAGEIRSLSPASFNLEAGCVTVRASYSKRRRTDTQQLPPWLVQELKDWLARGGQLWECFPENHPGRLLKADLLAAGVPYAVQGGEGHPLYFDFHALRHWYCTWAGNLPGISPRTLLALTRHSSVELALRTYAKVKPEEIRAAVNQLPPPASSQPPQK